jgi:hypothetical protein
MTDSEKSSWPKLPGGAIDWEVVFEDPSSGLIPLIAQAQSATALRDSTILVINQIYTRQDDPPEVERFTAELTMMIPANLPEKDLPRITEVVTTILRQIKVDRIRKAEEYEREMAEEAAAKADESGESAPPKKKRVRKDNRRGSSAAKRRSFKARQKRIRIFVALAVTAVVGLAVFGYLVMLTPDPWDPSQPNLVLIEQMKSAALGEGPETHTFGGPIKTGERKGNPFVTAEELPQEACFSVSWVLKNKGVIVINDKMAKKLSPGVIRTLCDLEGRKARVIWFPK